MTDFNMGQPESYKKVGGWLALLCFALVIGGPLKTLYNLVTAYNEAHIYFDQLLSLKYLFYIDTVLSIVLMSLSVRAGIALWQINPEAVKIAKNYLLIFLGYTVAAIFLPFMVGLPSIITEAMVSDIIKETLLSFFFFGIWFWYLKVSIRVKETYATYPVGSQIVSPDKEDNDEN